MNSYTVYNLRLARTLYNNFYRARLSDANGEDAGQILIVPGLPMDRSLVPPSAPEAKPYLLIIVEDANINKDNVVDFEEGVSRAVLDKIHDGNNEFRALRVLLPVPGLLLHPGRGVTEKDPPEQNRKNTGIPALLPFAFEG